jgi:hypothetical protein
MAAGARIPGELAVVQEKVLDSIACHLAEAPAL